MTTTNVTEISLRPLTNTLQRKAGDFKDNCKLKDNIDYQVL